MPFKPLCLAAHPPDMHVPQTSSVEKMSIFSHFLHCSSSLASSHRSGLPCQLVSYRMIILTPSHQMLHAQQLWRQCRNSLASLVPFFTCEVFWSNAWILGHYPHECTCLRYVKNRTDSKFGHKSPPKGVPVIACQLYSLLFFPLLILSWRCFMHSKSSVQVDKTGECTHTRTHTQMNTHTHTHTDEHTHIHNESNSFT